MHPGIYLSFRSGGAAGEEDAIALAVPGVSLTRGNASGFWSLTVLPGGQGFLGRLGAPRDLFEFQVRGCSRGFLCGSFGRA